MSDFLSNFDSKKKETEEKQVEDLSRRNKEEVFEIDVKYKKKKKKQKIILIVLTFVLILISFLTYYQLSRMLMPDFTGKSITEVNKWAAKNKINVETKQSFSLEVEKNHVIEQSVKANQKVKKNSEITFTLSQGGNPDDIVALPDFKSMSEQQVEDLIKKEQLENLTLVTEFSEEVPSGQFINEELANEGTRDTFKRADNGKIIFSKGKEVYKKDISVPDFSGKTQTEVESWAKTNEIELDIKKVASETIQNGQIVKQSIAPKEKVAKKTKMSIEVSGGKGIYVPDFSKLTKETAATQGNLQVTVEERFSEEIPYGQLISQSKEIDEELTEADDLKVDVVYSAGKPYLKDLSGEIEGDLQKIFFEEFHSKGANINYVVNYVNSELPKGTVVNSDAYGTYLPLDYTVTVNISLGY